MLMRPASLAVGALAAAALFVLFGPSSTTMPTGKADRAGPRPAPSSPPQRIDIVAVPARSSTLEAPAAAQGPERDDAASARLGTATSRVAAPQAGERFDLEGAERIALKFQGYSELTGEYRVSADGTISIPVIGRVSIANLNSAALEQGLAHRVARLTGRETFVTVEVVEFRNVFVSGFVSRPGAYPWRPGQTVLHALANAGGTFRTGSEPGASFDEDQIVARLQKAIAHKVRMLAALARLDAERAELTTVEIPQRLIELVGKSRASAAIRAEEPSLVSRMAALAAKRVALARAIEMSGRELTGLKAQAGRLETQLAARRIQKRKIDELQEKGIVRAERSMDEFARVADLEDRSTNIAVSIAKIEATIAGLERDRVNLEFERQAELETEVNRIGHEIAQLDIDIESERLRFRKLTGAEPPSGFAIIDAPKKAVITFNIVRRTSTGPTNMKAEQLTELRPDDILVVNID